MNNRIKRYAKKKVPVFASHQELGEAIDPYKKLRHGLVDLHDKMLASGDPRHQIISKVLSGLGGIRALDLEDPDNRYATIEEEINPDVVRKGSKNPDAFTNYTTVTHNQWISPDFTYKQIRGSADPVVELTTDKDNPENKMVSIGIDYSPSGKTSTNGRRIYGVFDPLEAKKFLNDWHSAIQAKPFTYDDMNDSIRDHVERMQSGEKIYGVKQSNLDSPEKIQELRYNILKQQAKALVDAFPHLKSKKATKIPKLMQRRYAHTELSGDSPMFHASKFEEALNARAFHTFPQLAQALVPHAQHQQVSRLVHDRHIPRLLKMYSVVSQANPSELRQLGVRDKGRALSSIDQTLEVLRKPFGLSDELFAAGQKKMSRKSKKYGRLPDEVIRQHLVIGKDPHTGETDHSIGMKHAVLRDRMMDEGDPRADLLTKAMDYRYEPDRWLLGVFNPAEHHVTRADLPVVRITENEKPVSIGMQIPAVYEHGNGTVNGHDTLAGRFTPEEAQSFVYGLQRMHGAYDDSHPLHKPLKALAQLLVKHFPHLAEPHKEEPKLFRRGSRKYAAQISFGAPTGYRAWVHRDDNNPTPLPGRHDGIGSAFLAMEDAIRNGQAVDPKSSWNSVTAEYPGGHQIHFGNRGQVAYFMPHHSVGFGPAHQGVMDELNKYHSNSQGLHNRLMMHLAGLTSPLHIHEAQKVHGLTELTPEEEGLRRNALENNDINTWKVLADHFADQGKQQASDWIHRSLFKAGFSDRHPSPLQEGDPNYQKHEQLSRRGTARKYSEVKIEAPIYRLSYIPKDRKPSVPPSAKDLEHKEFKTYTDMLEHYNRYYNNIRQPRMTANYPDGSHRLVGSSMDDSRRYNAVPAAASPYLPLSKAMSPNDHKREQIELLIEKLHNDMNSSTANHALVRHPELLDHLRAIEGEQSSVPLAGLSDFLEEKGIDYPFAKENYKKLMSRRGTARKYNAKIEKPQYTVLDGSKRVFDTLTDALKSRGRGWVGIKPFSDGSKALGIGDGKGYIDKNGSYRNREPHPDAVHFGFEHLLFEPMDHTVSLAHPDINNRSKTETMVKLAMILAGRHYFEQHPEGWDFLRKAEHEQSYDPLRIMADHMEDNGHDATKLRNWIGRETQQSPSQLSRRPVRKLLYCEPPVNRAKLKRKYLTPFNRIPTVRGRS